MALAVHSKDDFVDRRRTILGWLTFVQDFGNLDVAQLITKVAADDTFVEAVEAVLHSQYRPWAAFEAVRDFCISQLVSNGVKSNIPITPRTRVSPFSVPTELLYAWARDIAPNFNVARDLRMVNRQVVVEVMAGKDAVSPMVQLNQDEYWLVTTLSAQVLPEVTGHNHRIRITDVGVCRELFDGKLYGLHDAVPCFFPVERCSALRIEVHDVQQEKSDGDIAIIFTIEGWKVFLR